MNNSTTVGLLYHCFALKCLYLLIEKRNDENFVLAGSGIEIEFCFLCHVLRVFEVMYSCFKTKIN